MSSEQVIAEMRDFAKGATIMDVMDAPAIVAKWADRLSTPANMVTVPASELRAMREEIERLSTASTDDAELIESLEAHGWHKATATIRQLQARNAEQAERIATLRETADRATGRADEAQAKLTALLDGIDGLERDLLGADWLTDSTEIAHDLKAMREKANG